MRLFMKVVIQRVKCAQVEVDKKIVGKIIDHYSALPFLAAALKKRKIPEGTVCTWKYLAKVLKVNIVEKPRPIPPKVTLIM